MKHNKKLILLAFFIISTFFTFWYAVSFSFSRAGDARVARAFITDEADLCEIIIKTINKNEEFNFDAYGFFYYKSGIVILKMINKVAVVSERTVLIFFRLYSWFYFLALVLVLTLLTYKLTGIYGAFFALALSFIASPNLLLYAAMLHPDVAQVFFIVLSLYWLYLFVSNGKNWYILLSAASAALAFSCKYSGVLMLPVIYTAIFLSKTNDNKYPDRLYLQNIISLILLSLTYYFLNNSEISNHIGSTATGNEILFYLKIIKYLCLLTGIFIMIAMFAPSKFKELFYFRRIQRVLFLIILTSYVFIATYLLTVINLLKNNAFLDGFINVIGFHSVGHNFIEEGGFLNWLSLALQSDNFGLLIPAAFLISIIVLVFKIKNMNQSIKIVLISLMLWQFVFLGSLILRVKSMWGHYLLPAIPVAIILVAFVFQKTITIKKNILKYVLLLPFLLLISERASNAYKYIIKKKAEEKNAASMKAGNWLAENVDTTSIISANNYCYVPKQYKNVNFNWGTRLEDLYNENIDFILTHTKVLDDFEDPLLAPKYKFGSDTYLNRHKMRSVLLKNERGIFELLKDFGDAKIFKRIGQAKLDTLFFSSCNFDELSNKNWSINVIGIDSLKTISNNKFWHFRNNDEWGPTFSIDMDSMAYNQEYLIEFKVKLYATELPEALMICQINEKQEVDYWQKTEISTQNIQKDEWGYLYTNLIISKKTYDKKGLKFSAYIWNLNRNDFYVDDMKIIIKAL